MRFVEPGQAARIGCCVTTSFGQAWNSALTKAVAVSPHSKSDSNTAQGATDDFVFGVAAIGAGGQESLVSAYVTVPPRDPEVKIIR